MLGIDFVSFLILLIISIVVCAILHFGCKYYVIPGIWSYCSKVVVGWVGAWLGSPVLGHWFDGLKYAAAAEGAYQLYIIPAILGSAALVVLVVDVAEVVSVALGGPRGPGKVPNNNDQ